MTGFAHPHLWPLLLLVPLIGALLLLESRWRVRACAVLKIEARSKRMSYSLQLFALFCLAVAMMGPVGNPRLKDVQNVAEKGELTGGKSVAKIKRHRGEILFLLDTSASMEVADMRTKESRLDCAKEIIDQLISLMDGESIALYAFTSEVTPIVPLTLDYLYTRLSLRRVAVNEGDAAGTDLLSALERIELGKRGAANLILLTDGGDTRLERLEGAERERETMAILSRVSTLKGVRTFTIGLGTKGGEVIPGLLYEGSPVRSSLDEVLLKQIAERGKGRYFFASDFSALGLAREIVKELKSEPVEEEQSLREASVETKSATIEVDRYFQIPLLLAMLGLVADRLLRHRQARSGEVLV